MTRQPERVPLTRRRDKLYLKGAKGAAPLKPDLSARRRVDLILDGAFPNEWNNVVYAAMPRMARDQRNWADEKWRLERFRYGLRGYHVPPWDYLRIHQCADCGKAWYIAHHAVKRCEPCQRAHDKDRVRAWNAGMIERRADARAKARADMACKRCGKAMTGKRLRQFCSHACRQAAYRERAA